MPTVMISGVSKGLGYELARQYADDGWTVYGTVRSEASASSVSRDIPEIRTEIVDVRNVDAIYRAASRMHGSTIDHLICNAGIYGPRNTEFGNLDASAWQEIVNVNLIGAAIFAEAFANNVKKSQHRLIAFMSSKAGSIHLARGREFMYGASKAALNHFARNLSVLLKDNEINVICVSPGWVRTEMGTEAADLEPHYSAGELRSLFKSVTADSSGKFLNYDGDYIEW